MSQGFGLVGLSRRGPNRGPPKYGTRMPALEDRFSTVVLVIGTDGAGLRAAIELAEAGIDVLAVGKRPAVDAHTSLAAAK